MPSSEVSLALFVPLIAKPDKDLDVSAFLGAGYDLVKAEPDTIQWFGVKYADQTPATYAIFDTFRAETGRAAHLNGKVAEALMANAATLLGAGPDIMQANILANKVVESSDLSKTSGLANGLRVILTAKPETVDAVREFLTGALELVEAEAETPVWYAVEFPGTNKFAIVDFFADEKGRDAHLTGAVAEALFANADALLATPPDLVKVDVIAAIVKFRPRALDDLHYHQGLSARLKSLAASGDFPHMLFYGPSGAGKKTRVTCTMRQLFGPGVEKLKIDQRVFLTPSKRKIEVNIVQSNFHIEITPSEAGNYDRVIVQELLKEIAQTQQVDLNAKQRFKVVIINEADSLSRDAQAALRRTMEKYMSNLRVILVANSTSRLIAPIKSRCLLMRVAAPSEEEMHLVLVYVAKRAYFDLPPEAAEEVVRESGGNLRKAILMLEALKMQSPDLSGPLTIAKPDWETYCQKVANLIVTEQTPARVMEIRTKFYELLSHCIPPTVIIKTVAEAVVSKVDEPLKADIMHWAAFYETRMCIGSKKIYHLEAWVVKVMSLYKQSFYSVDMDEF